VIDMQVGAKHKIDAGRIDTSPPQPVEETAPASLMPGRNFGTILAFTDAAVDQQCSAAGPKDEALDRESGFISCEIEEFRLQRATVRLKQLRIGFGEELRQRESKVVIVNDNVDDGITDRKPHEKLLTGSLGETRDNSGS
jgi:hypothetical protein